MRKIIAVITILLISGCSYMPRLPSFWDGNQSVAIVDIRLATEQFDCTQPHLPQLQNIKDRLRWFDLYSRGKGGQADVIAVVTPLNETVADFYKRSKDKEGSQAYCKIKREIMITQSSRAAEVILGRF